MGTTPPSIALNSLLYDVSVVPPPLNITWVCILAFSRAFRQQDDIEHMQKYNKDLNTTLIFVRSRCHLVDQDHFKLFYSSLHRYSALQNDRPLFKKIG